MEIELQYQHRERHFLISFSHPSQFSDTGMAMAHTLKGSSIPLLELCLLLLCV